ncbi:MULTISPECIES: hypothetical protein [Pseudomonas]|uniref:Uncharacterized protein n=1 Tax=Pseudomonas wuhanensis TaxID=2954098 RepID=A0ABY9GPG9_9PSED|nr:MULTISPECIES: hypothetical protein [unclassified Pseudomonas]WLI11764.1 hypothetical protein PSH65_27120 [Pseudomonas sp. FP603]WLI17606.1 hypothetical protein PSH88_25755 [Pseudomonas sp. FP607]
MQLRFTSFAVASLRRDFHPQDCAHAGRTIKKAAANAAAKVRRWIKEQQNNVSEQGAMSRKNTLQIIWILSPTGWVYHPRRFVLSGRLP